MTCEQYANALEGLIVCFGIFVAITTFAISRFRP
jgi:hypothetical protein